MKEMDRLINGEDLDPKTLDDKLVKGKIVLCEGNIGAAEALRVGVVGVLTQEHTFPYGARPYPLPKCTLQSKEAADIHKYIRSTRHHQVQVPYRLTIVFYFYFLKKD